MYGALVCDPPAELYANAYIYYFFSFLTMIAIDFDFDLTPLEGIASSERTWARTHTLHTLT